MDVFPRHGRPQGENGIEDLPQHIDVGAGIDGIEFAPGLLRGDVWRRTHDHPVHRLKPPSVRRSFLAARIEPRQGGGRRFGAAMGRGQVFGQAPVHHQDLPVCPDHDVLGFEIAMHHPLGMGESHGVADLLEDGDQHRQGILRRDLRLPRSQPPNDVIKRDPFHKLHRVEGLPVRIDAELVNRHNIRMLQLAG